MVHLPFYILNLPTIFPLFLAGHFLYCAKLIPLSNVSNVWLRFYTGMRPCQPTDIAAQLNVSVTFTQVDATTTAAAASS